LVEALRHELEGHGLISQCGQWDISLTYPSYRTMALGLTQPLIEMSTRNISLGGKGGQCVGLTTLPSSCGHSLKILVALTSWSHEGLMSIRRLRVCIAQMFVAQTLRHVRM